MILGVKKILLERRVRKESVESKAKAIGAGSTKIVELALELKRMTPGSDIMECVDSVIRMLSRAEGKECKKIKSGIMKKDAIDLYC